MSAYEAYFSGQLSRHELSQGEVDEAIEKIDMPEAPVMGWKSLQNKSRLLALPAGAIYLNNYQE